MKFSMLGFSPKVIFFSLKLWEKYIKSFSELWKDEKSPHNFSTLKAISGFLKNTQITKNGWSWKVETFHVSSFQQGSLLGGSEKIMCAHTHKHNSILKQVHEWLNSTLSCSVQTFLSGGDLLFSETESLAQTRERSWLLITRYLWFPHTRGQ